MEVPERDSTRDWELPEDARPPLLSELVARIDEALATARASEAAVMTVGAAAIDAAEQAKRAADLAERASAAMVDDRPTPTPRRQASERGGRRQPSRLQRPRRPARGAAEAAAEDAGDPAGVGRTRSGRAPPRRDRFERGAKRPPISLASDPQPNRAGANGRRDRRVHRADRHPARHHRDGAPVRRRADHPQRRALRPRGHLPGADRRADEGARPVRGDDPRGVRRAWGST